MSLDRAEIYDLAILFASVEFCNCLSALLQNISRFIYESFLEIQDWVLSLLTLKIEQSQQEFAHTPLGSQMMFCCRMCVADVYQRQGAIQLSGHACPTRNLAAAGNAMMSVSQCTDFATQHLGSSSIVSKL